MRSLNILVSLLLLVLVVPTFAVTPLSRETAPLLKFSLGTMTFGKEKKSWQLGVYVVGKREISCSLSENLALAGKINVDTTALIRIELKSLFSNTVQFEASSGSGETKMSIHCSHQVKIGNSLTADPLSIEDIQAYFDQVRSVIQPFESKKMIANLTCSAGITRTFNYKNKPEDPCAKIEIEQNTASQAVPVLTDSTIANCPDPRAARVDLAQTVRDNYDSCTVSLPLPQTEEPQTQL